MIASLVFALCLLFQPPTPPVYQGFVMSEDRGRVWFARTNANEPRAGMRAFVLNVTDKDKAILLESLGKPIQIVARESRCHGTVILRVSWWKFKPTRELKQ